MNGQTGQRRGKVTASPRAKAKVSKGRRKHPGKGNHNQDQAGSPNEDTQRMLGDFGIKRQRHEFVGDVQEKMMILRVPDWIEQLVCFAFKSAIVLRWIRRNCQVRRREFFFRYAGE